MKCAHKNCNEPRLDVSRFCNSHYDEARAVATGHGYDAVPNVTVFAETPEALETSLKHYRSMGYVEVENHLGRRVGEGIEMRYVRQSPADAQLQSDIQAMQQSNKRADRNQFAAPAAINENLVTDLLRTLGLQAGNSQYRLAVSDILKSYGIIGGAK